MQNNKIINFNDINTITTANWVEIFSKNEHKNNHQYITILSNLQNKAKPVNFVYATIFLKFNSMINKTKTNISILEEIEIYFDKQQQQYLHSLIWEDLIISRLFYSHTYLPKELSETFNLHYANNTDIYKKDEALMLLSKYYTLLYNDKIITLLKLEPERQTIEEYHYQTEAAATSSYSGSMSNELSFCSEKINVVGESFSAKEVRKTICPCQIL